MAAGEHTIMLRGCRASFLTLAEPERYQNKPTNEPRWSATGLLPYDDPQIKKLDEMIQVVGKAKFEKKWGVVFGNIEGDRKMQFKVDGKYKDYAGYEGHFAITAHRKMKEGPPVVIDTDKSPIYTPTRELYPGKAGRVYSGCYVNMHIELWAQDNEHGKTVRATLLGIQRVKDGDAFAGGSAPDADAFEEVAEGADADDLA